MRELNKIYITIIIKPTKALGYTDLMSYKQGAYEIIKDPEKVYVVKNKKEIGYIFVKGDRVVISNDDLLAIKTYYKLYSWVEDFEKKLKMDGNNGVIRLL